MNETELEHYIAVLEWEEDMLEDREANVRMSDEHGALRREAFHRRLQEVKTDLKEARSQQ